MNKHEEISEQSAWRMAFKLGAIILIILALIGETGNFAIPNDDFGAKSDLMIGIHICDTILIMTALYCAKISWRLKRLGF